MSLTDALLLDPYRDPREIWLVPSRADGQRGDGSQADPYNCGSLPHPTVVVSELKKDDTEPTKAVVTTTGPHGFRTGDLVTIGGVAIQLANLNDNHYVGTFEITYESLDSFSYSLPGTPASLTAPVPFGEDIQCWRERELFDVVMRNAPENCVIHLGVGEFQTKGSSLGGQGGWVAQSGQRFLGAGMGLTTLKLVNAAGVGWRKYWAIFAARVNGFEVSDLTVDCAVDEQLSPFTNCAAIAVLPPFGQIAHHIVIRRVRVINFGSNGPLGIGVSDGAYSENFPIFVGGTDVVNVVYEDCVAEQPGPNVAWNSVILLAAGGYIEPTGKVYYGRALVLRNNYINGQLVYGPRAYVQSIDIDDNAVKLTTKRPHGYKVPGIVSVQGVKVGGNTNNRFNGVFKIDDPAPTDTDTELRYTVFIPNTDLGEVTGAPSVDGNTVIGAPVSPHHVQVDVISVAEDKKTFTVKTRVPAPTRAAPHNLTVNNRTWISGVELNGFVPPPDPLPDPPDPPIPKSLTHSTLTIRATACFG